MSVKIGYLLPTRERIMDHEPSTVRLIELAEKAETLGYDSLWVGDSLFARPRHEPMTLLAGVATRTQRVELGTAVLLPALRNPVLLAHQAATLDQLCEGRLILGLGIAGDVPNIRAEFEAAGVPFEKRVGRLLEGVKLCRALWSGEEVNWDGLWSVKGATLGPTPARPGGPLLGQGGTSRAQSNGPDDTLMVGFRPARMTQANGVHSFTKSRVSPKIADVTPMTSRVRCTSRSP